LPEKAVYLLAMPGFADWEPAHALAELRRHAGYRVEVVTRGPDTVESMGGLRIQPTRTLAELALSDIAALVLPGGDCWEQIPLDPTLADLLHRLDAAAVPIAAICGATIAVAQAGLLRDRRHTSNGPGYLAKHVPTYSAEAQYVDEPAVRDRGLITASGLGDVEFARELMAELDVLTADDRTLWTTLFRSGRLPTGTA